MRILKSQSTKEFRLLKNLKTKLYYIRRIKDKKLILLGDRDESETFILDGLHVNKQEVLDMFNKKDQKDGTK